MGKKDKPTSLALALRHMAHENERTCDTCLLGARCEVTSLCLVRGGIDKGAARGFIHKLWTPNLLG